MSRLRPRFKVGRRKWEFVDGKYQPVILEEHVLKEIVTRLWFEAKIRVERINCPVGGKVRPNMPGIPDLMGWLPRSATWTNTLTEPSTTGASARPLFIEVKRPGGVRRPAQIRFIEEAKSDGCVAFFAESWADVVREFGQQAGIALTN